MISEDISRAKAIISEHALEQYVTVLLDYWAEHPPSLGHGFAHALRVANRAYAYGEQYEMEHPEYLFVIGFLHDIYRPARGEDGKEDHTGGAEIIRGLFDKPKFTKELIDRVVFYISTHESLVGEKEPPLDALLVAVADATDLDTEKGYAYIWSSNIFLVRQGKKPAFRNYFEALYAFKKYQTESWELFAEYRLQYLIVEDAIQRFIRTEQDLVSDYLSDMNGESFEKHVYAHAYNCVMIEHNALAVFVDDEEKLRAILADGWELLESEA